MGRAPGTRVAATAAALFFGTGLVIGGIGLAIHQSVLVFIGMGLIGGIGCGLGYIAPVSTLVKWFPDRRGMATGMAIMGFGGGAFLAGYLNVYLMNQMGIARTVITLGVVYLAIMLIGARILRRPPEGWKPHNWTPPTQTNAMIATRSVTRNQALETVQFYLLWGILFINVTAGIGILAQASPMMQDMFHKTPLEAAAVVSLISVFNAGGRFCWASLSDYIGRRNTYTTFFVVQVGLFLLIPQLAASGNWSVFLAQPVRGLLHVRRRLRHHPRISFADLFGAENVGAQFICALLTAWSAAAVAGPLIITELSNQAKAALAPGASRIHIYDRPLEVLAVRLSIGFVHHTVGPAAAFR